MKHITLDLQPRPMSPTMRFIQQGFFFLLGVMILVQGIVIESDFRYVNLTFGSIAILFALFYRRVFPPKVFTFDDEGFEGPIGIFNTRRYRWEEISHINATMFLLEVVLKPGTTVEINLENITYQQHKQIKPMILELAKTKGVDLRSF